MNRFLGLATIACVALTTTACGDDDVTGPDDDANFQVVLKPESSAAGTTQRIQAVVPDPLRAIVALENVTSITLPIGRVEAHQVGGAWIQAGVVNNDVDLLALPADGIELVESELPEGDYDGLRFFLTDEATITLAEAVLVGRTTFEAGAHDLVIPSADQSGLKLNAAFSVDENGELLTVLFDGDATVRHVTATGSGVLKIAPVLRVMNGDGDDVGGIDEGDADFDAEFEGVVETVSSGGFTLTNGTVVEIGATTEIDGDLLSLAAVAAALAAGETVEAEGEGDFAADGTTILAAEVDFDLEEDADDDVDEVEFEGNVTAVSGSTFTLGHAGGSLVVTVAGDTEIAGDFDTFADMTAAFDAGTVIAAEVEGTMEAGGNLLATEVDFDAEDEDEEEFEGTITAVDAATRTIDVRLASGATVQVAVVSTTVVDAGGDLTTFADVVAAFAAGTDIEVEGVGTVDTTTEVLTASRIRFETDG